MQFAFIGSTSFQFSPTQALLDRFTLVCQDYHWKHTETDKKCSHKKQQHLQYKFITFHDIFLYKCITASWIEQSQLFYIMYIGHFDVVRRAAGRGDSMGPGQHRALPGGVNPHRRAP